MPVLVLVIVSVAVLLVLFGGVSAAALIAIH